MPTKQTLAELVARPVAPNNLLSLSMSPETLLGLRGPSMPRWHSEADRASPRACSGIPWGLLLPRACSGGSRLLGLYREHGLVPEAAGAQKRGNSTGLDAACSPLCAPSHACSGGARFLGLCRERGLVPEAAEAGEQDERGAGRQRGEGPPQEAPDVARVCADRDVRQAPRDRVAVRQDDACAGVSGVSNKVSIALTMMSDSRPATELMDARMMPARGI